MRATSRFLTATLTAVGLVAGALTVTAAPASAADPVAQAPVEVMSFGYNYGLDIDWYAPENLTDVVGFRVNLYAATDTTHSTVVKTQTQTLAQGDDGEFLAEFSGLTIGQKYVGGVVTRFTGDTVSDEVFSAPGLVSKPIAAVGGLTLTPGNKSMKVSWKKPATNAQTGTLLGYVVTRPGDFFGTYVSLPATSVKLTGLTNGRKYAITVFAIANNDIGYAATKSATPIAKPAKPTKFKRAWKSGGKAKLTWKAKSTAAAPVTGYYVYVNGKKVATLNGKSKTSYTAKKLKKGKKYSFSVRARNATGTSSSATIGKAKRP